MKGVHGKESSPWGRWRPLGVSIATRSANLLPVEVGESGAPRGCVSLDRHNHDAVSGCLEGVSFAA